VTEEKLKNQEESISTSFSRSSQAITCKNSKASGKCYALTDYEVIVELY
jgi:hypothetical protein